jgi:putative ABC transport system permease protein
MATLILVPTLRNLLRNRLYTGLNLSGLAIGMAAAMLIALWVQNELRFDRYHHKSAAIWRIEADHKVKDGQALHWGGAPLKTSEICEKIPGIVTSTQFLQLPEYKTIIHHGTELFREDQLAYVGPGWFELFDYTFVEGSAAGFGEGPNDMILTESLARKIFGDQKALGSVLRLDTADFAVHAVIRPRSPPSARRYPAKRCFLEQFPISNICRAPPRCRAGSSSIAIDTGISSGQGRYNACHAAWTIDGHPLRSKHPKRYF